MNKQDAMKIQTCVLRVNIHCDGCKHKVEKKLQKIEGVYKVSIDVDQGKVTVSGNVDPATIIKKLEKSGKHAELWGAQKGPISIMNNQFKNIQFENPIGGKDGKAHKGGKDQQKGGFQAPQQMHQKTGSKDVRFLGKAQKSVKFNLPEEEEEDDFDEFDEYDDEFDDEFDEDFADLKPHSKGAPVAGRGGHVPQANKATSNGHMKSNNGVNSGGNGKKGGGLNMFLKGMLGKAGSKNGKDGKSHNKAGNQKKGGKNSGKNGGEGKNGEKNGKVAFHNTNAGGKIKDFWSMKGGENYNGGPKLGGRQPDFNEMNENHRGGNGRNVVPMDQMRNFLAVQGLPAAAAMNGGHFQGLGQGNPYNQQYMAQMMMMMNQQRENGYNGYHPSLYMRPQPAMSYGPPPPVTDQYTHIFSDENTGSCSIM